MKYADYEFVSPIPNGDLSDTAIKFRNTILIAEHGTKISSIEGKKVRVLKDGNHANGALGNVVLLASHNPDYYKHGKGWVKVPINKASPRELKAIEALIEKYGLSKPTTITRLGLYSNGKIKYWSYFVFASDGLEDHEFNKYIEARFPAIDEPPTTPVNMSAIISYGGHGGYWDFWYAVYRSWLD